MVTSVVRVGRTAQNIDIKSIKYFCCLRPIEYHLTGTI